MGGLPASVPPARHTHIHGLYYSRYGMRSARGMDGRNGRPRSSDNDVFITLYRLIYYFPRPISYGYAG